MRLWEIFRHDAATQLRRPTTAIYAAGLAAMTMMVASTFFDDVVRDGILLNAPMVTLACTILVSMTGVLVTAALAAEAGTRDAQARIEALLYTTPLSKAAYLGGRFLSAFAINTLLLAVAPATLLAWTFVPIGKAAAFGPFHFEPYLRAFLLFGVGNSFVTTAVLFSLVVLTRQPMASYAGAAALFLNSAVQEGIVAGVLARWELAKHLDLFGFVISAAQWRSRSPMQRNSMPLELDAAFVGNRLLWVTVGGVALAIAYARFRMAHQAAAAGRAGWWRRRRASKPDSQAGSWTATFTPPRVRGTFDAATRARQVSAIALRSFAEMIGSRGALIIPAAMWIAWNAGPELLEFGLGTPSRPNTGRLALLYGRFQMSGIAVAALIALFSGVLVWRERDAREHDVADAVPVPDVVMIAGKFAALMLVIVVMQTALIATGVATQIAAGYFEVEPLLWIRILLGVKLVDYALLAALAFALQVVANQKYLGTALVMAAAAFPQYAGAVGIRHHLLLYGSDPGLPYSDFNGFGAAVGPWLLFKLYWGGWALLLALLARLFWVRGHDPRMHTGLRERFTRPLAGAGAAALALVTVAGGFIFYNTNVLNEYVSDDDAVRASADYEHRYGHYAGLAQPLVTAMKLRVELLPSRGRAAIHGTYQLQNRSGRAIDQIHLVTRRSAPVAAVAFDRPARATRIDRELGYDIYSLASPLQPGASLRMDFDLALEPNGFTNDGVSPAIASNGTLLEHRPDDTGRSWLPAVGYRRSVELDNPRQRQAHGLPPRPAPPRLEDAAARTDARGIERIDLETVIGTDADQIAVAPGALRGSWSERGRRYFRYVTDAPIRNGFAILSARYAVHRSRWNGVDIEVLHHPRHAWNRGRIARAAEASLAEYSREFGPYPHRQLRLVEFPITGGTRLTGHPGTVIWSEAFAFAHPEADSRRIDFPFAVVAHEVAHQWWGNQVVPARVEGAPLLSESLAWYSAMNVVERALGREHLDRFMEVMRESYLVPHQTPEVPLLRANDWLAVYRTGALAMSTLRDSIGADRVNSALRAFLAEFGSGRPPFPTSLDLYRHLTAATPGGTRPLLKDLFEDITFWDLRVKSASAVRTSRDSYRVSVTVEAHKVKVQAGGRERRVPMDDEVEIAIYGTAGREPAPKAVLARSSHRIRSGEQTFTVVVSRPPSSAGVDPGHRLHDRNREDDLKDIVGSHLQSAVSYSQ